MYKHKEYTRGKPSGLVAIPEVPFTLSLSLSLCLTIL